MAYKSEAQRKFFNSKNSGVRPETVAEFNKKSEGRKLPERVGPKKSKSAPKMKTIEDLKAHYKSKYIK